MLPFEFIVPGTPVSQQTRNRAKLHQWRGEVRARAAVAWPPDDTPVDTPVQLRIVYYYLGDPLDTDNMIKPIQDALKGLVYSDDAIVTDVFGSKRPLEGSFRVRGMSRILAEGFIAGEEFLHVIVEAAPDPEVPA